MPAVVNQELCTGCKDCEPSCPNGAIAVPAEHAVVNADECIDCNTCMDACTSGAISMS